MAQDFPRKFSQEEKTPNFFENSNTKWYGSAVPAVPIDMTLDRRVRNAKIFTVECSSCAACLLSSGGLVC